jgi:hypothetical protein
LVIDLDETVTVLARTSSNLTAHLTDGRDFDDCRLLIEITNVSEQPASTIFRVITMTSMENECYCYRKAGTGVLMNE